MLAVMSALVSAVAALVGVLIGAGLQFLLARRTHTWQQQAAERTELSTAGAGYLTATWQLTQLIADAGRGQSSPFVDVDIDQVRRLKQTMTEARTLLDLIGSEAVYAATKRYHWRLLEFITAAEEGTLKTGTDVDGLAVELRRTLMNQIRSDIGRPPILRRWSPTDSSTNDDGVPVPPERPGRQIAIDPASSTSDNRRERSARASEP
jgi:hypothetical protein